MPTWSPLTAKKCKVPLRRKLSIKFDEDSVCLGRSPNTTALISSACGEALSIP